MGIDLWALLGTGLVALIGLGLRSLRRRSQARLQCRLDERFAAGLAVGKAENSGLARMRGHEDGLIEGRAQAERMDQIRLQQAYDDGFERGCAARQQELVDAYAAHAVPDHTTTISA